MSTVTALQLDYLSQHHLGTRAAPWWRDVLGVVGFERHPKIDSAPVPIAASMTPSLGAAPGLCEVWRIAGEPAAVSATLQQGRLQYRYCEDFLFGAIAVEERTIAGRGAARPGADSESAVLLHATQSAYREIFEVLRRTQHPHLIRIWNYLPEINRDADGVERYRHFNSARQAAFRESGRATVGAVPAACALGSPAGSPISIYFLAACRPPLMIENPRQTSAYHYSPKFGIHSPTFSRACVLGETTGTNLFVSGTASIVGQESIHAGDVGAQTRETLANIHALVEEANRVLRIARYSLERLKFKVYVRRPADLAVIEEVFAAMLRPAAPIVYLHADVCREDLLVEVEATGESMRI